MRTVLICHKGAQLSRSGISRWLASFSDLAGIVEIDEKRARINKRIMREIKRVGPIRFLDVLAFRAYYKLFLSKHDAGVEHKILDAISEEYEALSETIPTHTTASPNSNDTEAFIREQKPDLIIARCKTLLREGIYEIPSIGTFVMHPGICPEYRNAHGCFWALVNRDLAKVGMTLLKIDRGVDTGPIYGYYSYEFDERAESHIVIQTRVVFENLHRIRAKLLEITDGVASPIEVKGRPSAVWGQPWLSAYIKWKAAVRKNSK